MEGDFSVCLFGGGVVGGVGAACRAYVYRRGSTRVLGFWPALRLLSEHLWFSLTGLYKVRGL